MLDDILSALDVHVGKKIMEKAILGYLKNKTIIMPTHSFKYLNLADYIVMLYKGKVFASGSYN